MTKTLQRYAAQGYQVVFCPQGIRVWYLPAKTNKLLFQGNNYAACLKAIDEHYPNRSDDE